MKAIIHHGNAGTKIERLVKTYGFEYPNDYFNYILDTYANGYKEQVLSLFNEMTEDWQKTFLLNAPRMGIYGERVHDLIIQNL